MSDVHYPCGHANRGCAMCYASGLQAENARLQALLRSENARWQERLEGQKVVAQAEVRALREALEPLAAMRHGWNAELADDWVVIAVRPHFEVTLGDARRAAALMEGEPKEQKPVCRTCGGSGQVFHAGGSGNALEGEHWYEDCPSCRAAALVEGRDGD